MANMFAGEFEEFGLADPVKVQAAGNEVCHTVGTTAIAAGDLTLILREGIPIAPTPSSLTFHQLRMKRLIDVVGSSAALLMLAPLFLFTAAAIKLTSSGPVIFRQQRMGFGGLPFELYKFRTMHIDRCDPTGAAQTIACDERVTPLGRFLRATSIDELPQLFNVLAGSMSLVGPRPMVEGQRAAERDYREIVPYYDYRFAMKPGLTGWAQCHGLRGPTHETDRAIARIEYDCAYIQNFSMWLDFKTIVKTLMHEFLLGTGL